MEKMKQLVLLVVGADKCGKSNIVQELSKRINVPSFKATNEHLNFVHDQRMFINELRYSDFKMVDFLKQVGTSVIIDRAFPCEFVYSKFFKRETDVGALKRLDEEHAQLGTMVLICTRKSFAGIQDDLDPKLDSKALEEISKLYEEFAAWTKCQTHTLYVDDEDLEREIEEVLNFINHGTHTA